MLIYTHLAAQDDARALSNEAQPDMTPPATIAEKLRLATPDLTLAERKLMAVLFENYPVAGLSSITELAAHAKVSTPSVLRLAKKLGFSGFPAFQEALRREVSARLQNPLSKHARWSEQVPDGHIINRFASAVTDNLSNSLKLMDLKSFDAIVQLLGDRKRQLFITGGLITQALAYYLATHLKMARPGVNLASGDVRDCGALLLDMHPGDILFLFDIRRYDAHMLELAASAKERGARLVLITDQWISPIARLAQHSLPLRIEAPSSWDSNIVPLFVVETLIAAVINVDWPKTQARIRSLEKLHGDGRRLK